MGVRVALGGGAEPRDGSHEESRFTLTRSVDRAAAWIALATPLIATVVILVAR